MGVCSLACCWPMPQFPHCYLRFCITGESSTSSVLAHLGEHGVWVQRDKVTCSNPQTSFKQTELGWGSPTFENSLRFLYHSFATCLSLTLPLCPFLLGNTWISGLNAAVLFLKLNGPETTRSESILETEPEKNPLPDFPRRTRPI